MKAIPSLCIVSSDGEILSRYGVKDILRKGSEALKTWAKGEKLTPPTVDEYLWEDDKCNGCDMKHIIGKKYHCSVCDNYDLCAACEKKGHEHPLELVPQPVNDEYD